MYDRDAVRETLGSRARPRPLDRGPCRVDSGHCRDTTKPRQKPHTRAVTAAQIDAALTRTDPGHLGIGRAVEDRIGRTRIAVPRLTHRPGVHEIAGPGLEIDDLILKIDGRSITRVSEVAYLTQLAGVGAKVELTVRRGADQPTQIKVIVPEMGG